MLTKSKQENLPGYKPTALEVAVKDLLESKESKEAAKDMFDKRCLTVIDEMAKAGKRHLFAAGHEFTIKLTESKEKLVIKDARI